MPIEPIPFTPLNKSIDKTSTSVWNQSQYDGFWQEYNSPDGQKFAWAKRPGLTQFTNLGEPARVDGLFYWTRQGVLLASCNGKVFKITSAGVTTEITGTAYMTSGNRPTWDDMFGTNIYAASGGRIGAFPSTGNGAYIADAQAPTTVRFVVTINKVLVALNDSSERFDWADSIDPTSWSGLYANIESKPDLVLAMMSANNYLYFFGQETIEAWRDDGTTFVRESQGVLSRGCLARYSVCNVNGVFYWLDSSYEVSRLSGFTNEVVSNPALSRYIRTFSTVSDAVGDYLPIEGRHFYVLSFPTEQKTFVYDILLNQWYEWSFYDSLLSEHKQYRASCIATAPAWNKTLVGDRSSGIIYTIGGTTDNGSTIRTMLQSDFADRGAPTLNKFCHEVILTFKRSDTAASPKTMLIQWRDDGEAQWSNSVEVELEAIGSTQMVARVHRLGKYKTRQWRFIMTDETQSTILSALESFSYGG